MTTTLPHPTKKQRPATKPAAKPATKPGPKTAPKPATKPAARPGTRPAARTARARQQAKAPRTPFVLLIVGLLGGALVSLLLLNTVLAEDAFRLNDLQRTNTQLQQREQSLKVDVKKAESPTELAKRAHDLGMRPGPMTPKFASAKDPAGTAKYAGKHTTHHRHAKKAHTSATSHHKHRRSTADDSAFAGGGR